MKESQAQVPYKFLCVEACSLHLTKGEEDGLVERSREIVKKNDQTLVLLESS